MTPAPVTGPAVAERCRQALLAPTDRDELVDVLRVEALRKQVLADCTPMIDDEHDHLGAWAERSAVLMPFGRILYRIARALGGPAIEIGTGSAVSTAYLAAGLIRAGGAPLVTLELNPTLVQRARYHLNEANFTEVTVRQGHQANDAPALLAQTQPVLIHLDSDHRYNSTVALLDAVAAIGPDPTVMCLDDIRWSPEMEKIWTGLVRGNHGTIHTFDLDLWGIAILSVSSPDSPKHEKLWPPRGLTPAIIPGA